MIKQTDNPRRKRNPSPPRLPCLSLIVILRGLPLFPRIEASAEFGTYSRAGLTYIYIVVRCSNPYTPITPLLLPLPPSRGRMVNGPTTVAFKT